MRILLIEDDQWLSDAVVKLLKQEHYAVDPAFTGPEGLSLILTENYDAVILDVMLPEMDGFTVLRQARAKGIGTPIMMLTARGDVKDRVNGLQSGADYYIPKPFDKDELLACLKAITRRKGDTVVEDNAFGDILLSEKNGCLCCKTTGKEIKLSAKEYQLMDLFLRNPNQILSKDTILDRVWGYETNADYNNPEVYVSFLRRKLTFVGSRTGISTRRGLGYLLEDRND